MQPIKVYRCELCQNTMDVILDSGIPPICCGQPLTELNANTTGSEEVHVPALHRAGRELQVQIGHTLHPSLEDHYIQWIAVVQKGHVQRIMLLPSQKPIVSFTLPSDTDPATVYAFCNRHGLWAADDPAHP